MSWVCISFMKGGCLIGMARAQCESTGWSQTWKKDLERSIVFALSMKKRLLSSFFSFLFPIQIKINFLSLKNFVS